MYTYVCVHVCCMCVHVHMYYMDIYYMCTIDRQTYSNRIWGTLHKMI